MDFPCWDTLNEQDRALVHAEFCSLHYARGAIIHNPERSCIGVIFVTSGTIRVYLISEEGREITLFRVGPGESCVLAASCILPLINFDVFMDAETDCDIRVLPSDTFSQLMAHNPSLEAFAYRQTAGRFSEVMWVMQQVLFMSVDRRLAIFLFDEMVRTGSERIMLTHEQIARHMGTAREVITRMLRYFADEGLVELFRGGVRILDKRRLRGLTG
jgi:CRP/FNR family transcriptional regulator